MSLFGLLGAGSGSSIIRSPFVILSYSLARLERMCSNLLGGPGFGGGWLDMALFQAQMGDRLTSATISGSWCQRNIVDMKECICHGIADYTAGIASSTIFVFEEKTAVDELRSHNGFIRHRLESKASLHIVAIPKKSVLIIGIE
jgi:hypothetical protein